jgi:tetratricopeptide (TPR) repeat protein
VAGLLAAACTTLPTDGPQVVERPPLDDARELVRAADALAAARAYAAASRLYEEVIRRFPGDPGQGRALFGLGRLLVLADNPGRSYSRALVCFDRLLREHPESPQAADARAWRSVLAAYLARSEELERLKQADLELERRRVPLSGSSSSAPRR